jgi:CO/xanthine dehydrogenase Mo-binding subunit
MFSRVSAEFGPDPTEVALNEDQIYYHPGTMNDCPPVQCIINESHLGYGPYGACGIGEDVGASLSAITSSAIYNAVGKWVYDFPIAPDKVLQALGKIKACGPSLLSWISLPPSSLAAYN